MAFIPDRLTFVCRPRETYKDLLGNTFEVHNTFPAHNESSLNTARGWAWNGCTETEVKNVSRSDVRILNLERRSEGGRAYKVLVADKYMFDLREDVLLEAILARGIEKGGKLGGEYIFAVVGSQTRLVRVGSPQYHQVYRDSKIRAQKRIKTSDLVVGGIYDGQTQRAVYLGSGRIPEKHQELRILSTAKGNRLVAGDRDRASLSELPLKTYHFWLPLAKESEIYTMEQLWGLLASPHAQHWYPYPSVEAKTSHSMRVEVRQLPADEIERFKDRLVQEANLKLTQAVNRNYKSVADPEHLEAHRKEWYNKVKSMENSPLGRLLGFSAEAYAPPKQQYAPVWPDLFLTEAWRESLGPYDTA